MGKIKNIHYLGKIKNYSLFGQNTKLKLKIMIYIFQKDFQTIDNVAYFFRKL